MELPKIISLIGATRLITARPVIDEHARRLRLRTMQSPSMKKLIVMSLAVTMQEILFDKKFKATVPAAILARKIDQYVKPGK